MTRIAKPHEGRPQAARLRARRQLAFRLGLSAELRAALLLRLKGYRIVARRWRGPAGEIDLIARRGRLLAFVEVKARDGFDAAAWSVTPRQQRRIAAAARDWLGRHPDERIQDIRFDVILVMPWRLPRHLRGAFVADE
jgi:putative endonuclease